MNVIIERRLAFLDRGCRRIYLPNVNCPAAAATSDPNRDQRCRPR